MGKINSSKLSGKTSSGSELKNLIKKLSLLSIIGLISYAGFSESKLKVLSPVNLQSKYISKY